MFDQPINGETFTAYVEQAWLPTLTPGDVVVLDNLGSHKGKAVRHAIRKAGAHLMFLPPHSPDLGPIEQMFSSSKPCSEKPMNDLLMQHGSASAPCSTASRQTNAVTTSSTPVTHQHDTIMF